MTIDEYFSNWTFGAPRLGTKGCETEWLEFTDFHLRGRHFFISDVDFVGSEQDGLTIESTAGIYAIQVKAIDYDISDRRISRLRVCMDCSEIQFGKELGKTWTDTGRTAVCDLDYLTINSGSANEWLDEYIRPATETELPYGIALLGEPRASMVPFVDSGFGDGRFPVCELLNMGNRVGFEIEFISADETYPF